MKHIKIYAVLLAAVLIPSALTACTKASPESSGSSELSSAQSVSASDSSETEGIASPDDAGEFDLSFTARDLKTDYDEASAVKITLNGDSASISGSGASFLNGAVTISSEGIYLVSGSLSDGQLLVDAAKTDKIQIVLNGADIHCKTNAAIYIRQADKVFLTLAQGSKNTLSDGGEYMRSENDDNVDGVIFSKDDLTINGSGSLTVTAGYQHGIVSKDDLVITGGEITVNANGQGINGKDCVKIKDGTIKLTTQGDAIQSDNTEDTLCGFIYICGGTFDIDAQTDAIQAETLLRIDGGTATMKTGGGSQNASTKQNGDQNGAWGAWGNGENSSDGDKPSAKGLKAGTQLVLNGGTFTVDSSDDSIHSNGDITIANGEYTLSSGDDGIHADSVLTVSGGIILIEKSYEGLEGASIEISGSTIELTASDDGINIAGGNDSSSLGGRPGQNSFAADDSTYIRITGGKLTIDASGDGIDSNGSLYIEGGEIYVSGSINGGDGALDYDGEGTISGGTIVAVGSSGMAMGFSDSSSQCSLLYYLSSAVSAGSAVTLKDSSGNTVVTFTPQKSYQSAVISCEALKQGETYTLTCGSETNEITLDSIATSNGGGMGGGMGGGPGGNMHSPF